MSGLPESLVIARAELDIGIDPRMASRHGLIAGATGTGKTVTLRTLAEQFSSAGVPVFLPDIKGDLSGLPFPGGDNPRIRERVESLGLADFRFEGFPVTFWDVFGEQGHPVRTTVLEMGPLLMSRILMLNETQDAVLTLVYKIADDNGLLLLDLKDLRAMVRFVGDNADEYQTEYGHISRASIGAIQRNLLALEQQGADRFFGEPALDLGDLIRTDDAGRGFVNIFAADKLIRSPQLYATFLLWIFSELFELLPEVGDREKPVLVFFFDEAHLLFDDAPEVLIDKIEQVVRLIRSKGVGVYFVTQNPLDLPESVLGQLGNRVQHALRAFTPGDQKKVKAAADTFRPNPALDTAQVISTLEVGEALVSVLDAKGAPTMVQRALVLPPHSRLKPISPQERSGVVKGSALYGSYEQAVDRESAYEMLKTKSEEQEPPAPAGEKRPAAGGPEPGARAGEERPAAGAAGGKESVWSLFRRAADVVDSPQGRRIIRGVLGSFGSSRGRERQAHPRR
jgi:DNA helicase HerA-like ATPase